MDIHSKNISAHTDTISIWDFKLRVFNYALKIESENIQ
jgi:hypothetical protein